MTLVGREREKERKRNGQLFNIPCLKTGHKFARISAEWVCGSCSYKTRLKVSDASGGGSGYKKKRKKKKKEKIGGITTKLKPNEPEVEGYWRGGVELF